MTPAATRRRVVDWALMTCAAIVTVLAVRREVFADRPPRVQQVRDWPALEAWPAVASQGQTMGAVNAQTKIVVFSDFQCPACRVAHQVLTEFAKAHEKDVSLTVDSCVCR